MNKRKLKEERGEFTIEATIVMLITMAIVFFLMNIGFAVYHKQMVTAVATKTASDIAFVYGDKYKEPFYGYMQEDYFHSCSPYRYLLGSSLKNTNMAKARWYACYYLSEYQFTDEGSYQKVGGKYEVQKPGGFYDGVTVSVDKNAVGQREITVNIDTTYPVLTLNPVVILGVDPNFDCKATATAVCLDPIHDMMTVKLYQEIYKKITGDSYTLTGIDQLASAVNKIVNLCKQSRKDN